VVPLPEIVVVDLPHLSVVLLPCAAAIRVCATQVYEEGFIQSDAWHLLSNVSVSVCGDRHLLGLMNGRGKLEGLKVDC